MKRLTSLLIFVLLGAMVYAQDAEEPVAVDGPKLTFENETIDYGTIEQNSDGNREFVFTNTGTAPVVIDRCQGTCGCTVPECPKEPIMPGESRTIKVKYATNRLGRFNKGVKVYSNATPEGQPFNLYIKGNVLTKEEFDQQGENKEEEKSEEEKSGE